jgi:hypothetical protein
MGAYTDLALDQGSDFQSTLDLVGNDGSPINVAGYRFASQIRKSYYSVNATANIIVTVVNSANGNTVLSLDAANTANITPGRYLYDIIMQDTSNVTSRIVEGIITVNPGVTKNAFTLL